VPAKEPAIGVLIAAAAGSATFESACAGTFSNLDFEASPVAPNAEPSEAAPTSELFPSWTVRFGESVQTTGFINQILLGGDTVALIAANAPNRFLVEGTHSAYLQAAFTGAGVSFGQVGDVPAGTQSVRFLARNPYTGQLDVPPGVFQAQLDGHSLPVVPIWSASDGVVLDVLYGADVSAWAGVTSELRLAIFADPPSRLHGWAVLDAISFSPDPIPEPVVGSVSAFVIAAPLLVRSRSRRR
jgi:hypothetical protein